jgi:DNA-binding transcriptional MocR family regulator
MPELASTDRPVYAAIADALAADIEAGRLKAGDRLPPQRDLADRLGVTVMTVTRAYREAARRGLIEGQIGRGTYVRAGEADDPASGEPIDLTVNAVPPHAHLTALAARLTPSGTLVERARTLDYQPPGGMAPHRAAGRRLFEQRGWSPGDHEILVTAGAQHGLAVALMTLMRPGTALAAEEVTYAGLKALAATLRISLHPVAMDEEGLRADALETVCRHSAARVLYVMPSLQNPTGITMSDDRQRAIAAVVRQQDVTIIEDDAYGFVAPDRPLLAALVPERTVVLTSLSKSVAGGLRVGFVAAPPQWREALASSIWSTVVMASPVTADIGAALVNDGTAAAIMAWKRDELRARQDLARERLGRVPAPTHPVSPHVWLPLERPWKAEIFAARARARGVVVSPSSAFSIREGASPRAVRIALGVPRTRERLASALTQLARLHEEGPGSLAVV